MPLRFRAEWLGEASHTHKHSLPGREAHVPCIDLQIEVDASLGSHHAGLSLRRQSHAPSAGEAS